MISTVYHLLAIISYQSWFYAIENIMFMCLTKFCNFLWLAGPPTWRPDSSMSNLPDQPATVLSPSPPKQSRDTKSPSLSGRKRSSLPMATGTSSSGTTSNRSAPTGTTPRAMSSKPRSGVPERTPRRSAGVTPGKAGVVPGKAGASDVDNTLHWKLSQAEKAKGSRMAPGGPRKSGTGDHSASSSASSMTLGAAVVSRSMVMTWRATMMKGLRGGERKRTMKPWNNSIGN